MQFVTLPSSVLFKVWLGGAEMKVACSLFTMLHTLQVVSTIKGLGSLKVKLVGLSPSPGGEVSTRLMLPNQSMVDRLIIFNGGEAHVTDVSQWSPGVDCGKAAVFSNNAYLIQHGTSYMLWDTGLQDDLINIPDGKIVAHDVRGIVKQTLLSQLEEIGVKPEEISHIAFSHAHFDHVGNSSYFGNARWYVQEAEYNAMFGPDPAQYGFIPELYESMQDRLVVLTGTEYDVFGDGSVTILSTPGHTPGHQSMLVRLGGYGPVMLSGDVAHFWGNFCCRRIPLMNVSKEQSMQSMERVDSIVKAVGAKLWINHDYEQSKSLPHAPHWIQ